MRRSSTASRTGAFWRCLCRAIGSHARRVISVSEGSHLGPRIATCRMPAAEPVSGSPADESSPAHSSRMSPPMMSPMLLKIGPLGQPTGTAVRPQHRGNLALCSSESSPLHRPQPPKSEPLGCAYPSDSRLCSASIDCSLPVLRAPRPPGREGLDVGHPSSMAHRKFTPATPRAPRASPSTSGSPAASA